jgi:PPOX class probable F420-dependent enzyme
MLSLSDDQRAQLDERVQQDVVIWLTTVRSDGQPQTSPVWFIREGGEFLIYSMPSSQKVPNIRAHSKVSLTFEGDRKGGDVVTIEGEARIDEGTPFPNQVPAYIAKYEALVREMGAEPEPFARAYSTAIRVTPTRARVWR